MSKEKIINDISLKNPDFLKYIDSIEIVNEIPYIIINKQNKSKIEDNIDELGQYVTNAKIIYEENKYNKSYKVVAVVSGKGGVGKTTVSILYALYLKHLGYKVGILDADFTGPSITDMLDENDSGISVLSIASFVEEDQAIMLRGPMLSKTLNQFLSHKKWNGLDYLIIDTPPSTSDIHINLMQTNKIDFALLVSTNQNVAVSNTKRTYNMIKKFNVNILGAFLNMKDAYDFSKEFENFTNKNDIEIIGTLGFDKKLAKMMDNKSIHLISSEYLNKIFMQ
jgi:Mrp family chromosome partitioning ATPase